MVSSNASFGANPTQKLNWLSSSRELGKIIKYGIIYLGSHLKKGRALLFFLHRAN
jgi:hypothetical protein